MPSTSGAAKSTDTSSLNQSDWTDTALAALTNEGIDAVQITRLAKQLNVSRGSFYWHFDDRKALLKTMIRKWRQSNSSSFTSAINNASTLSEGVLAVFSLWVDATCFSPTLEQSVRDWARLDTKIQRIVQKEDEKRIHHLALLFERFNYSGDEAAVRARVLYFAQIGYYAMHMKESMQQRMQLTAHYYLSFTGRVLDTKMLQAFEEKYKELQ